MLPDEEMPLLKHPHSGDVYTIKATAAQGDDGFFPVVEVGPSRVSQRSLISTGDIEDALSLLLEARDDIAMGVTVCGIPDAMLRRFIDGLVAAGAKPV